MLMRLSRLYIHKGRFEPEINDLRYSYKYAILAKWLRVWVLCLLGVLVLNIGISIALLQCEVLYVDTILVV